MATRKSDKQVRLIYHLSSGARIERTVDGNSSATEVRRAWKGIVSGQRAGRLFSHELCRGSKTVVLQCRPESVLAVEGIEEYTYG